MKKKKIIIVAVIIVSIIIGYVIFQFQNGRISWTDLEVKTLSLEQRKKILDKTSHEIWDLDERSSPLYSPNKKYYVTYSPSDKRNAQVITIYKSKDNIKIGSYSFREVRIFGWEDDDSNLYIEDTELYPGNGFFLTPSSGYSSPLKKIILPND